MEKFSPHPPKYLMKNNPPKDPPAQLGAVQWSWAGETSLLCRYFFSPGAAAVPSSLTKEFISSIIPQKSGAAAAPLQPHFPRPPLNWFTPNIFVTEWLVCGNHMDWNP